MRADIPVPEAKLKRGPGSKYQFDKLLVGESFPVELESLKSVRSIACRKHKEGEARFLVGKHVDGRGVERWRCWRTE